MTRGKIIVVEGTDCSGKETQSKILIDNLKKMEWKQFIMDFQHMILQQDAL